MTELDRRRFLRGASAAVAVAATGPAWWRAAYADQTQLGPGPYGPLREPNADGLMLPDGFTSRVIARSGSPVALTPYVWPPFPDGAAIFPADDGGWFYAVNSEVLAGGGGASGVRFASDGTIVDAYPILRGTSGNCAGGPTPWGTWLSCEEAQAQSNSGEGQVWECDPTRLSQGVARPAMGRFNHEAVAVDPVGERLYLTEDRSDGCFYRFTPTAYPDLSAGRLEAAAIAGDGAVTWLPVPDPEAASTTTRSQVPAATAFEGGEGCWYDSGFVYFTTKGDNRVWVHDLGAQTLAVLYDAGDHGADPPLTGVDNIVVSSAGDLYVAEDGGNMEIVVISKERIVAPLLRYVDNDASELTGPVFDPSGTRLYFSSQRGPSPIGPGITFEVAGPFRRATSQAAASGPAASVASTVPPTTAALARPAAAATRPDATPRSTTAPLPATGASTGATAAVAAAAVAAAGIVRRTVRRSTARSAGRE